MASESDPDTAMRYCLKVKNGAAVRPRLRCECLQHSQQSRTHQRRQCRIGHVRIRLGLAEAIDRPRREQAGYRRHDHVRCPVGQV